MLSCSIWFSAPRFWMGGGLESCCVGRVYAADGAVARQHPHRIHDLSSGSQDHQPSKNSVQKTICCNSKSNAPDDVRMYPTLLCWRRHFSATIYIFVTWRWPTVAETCRRQHNKVGYKTVAFWRILTPSLIAYNTTGMMQPKIICYRFLRSGNNRFSSVENGKHIVPLIPSEDWKVWWNAVQWIPPLPKKNATHSAA